MKIASTKAIKTIMSEKGITNAELSRMCNVTPQVMYERLAKENLKVNTLHQMASILGYKVILVPDSVQVGDGCYEVM